MILFIDLALLVSICQSVATIWAIRSFKRRDKTNTDDSDEFPTVGF